jgi:hypothetical protein
VQRSAVGDPAIAPRSQVHGVQGQRSGTTLSCVARDNQFKFDAVRDEAVGVGIPTTLRRAPRRSHVSQQTR